MAETAAVFRRPFAEQVAAFRLRLSDLRPTRTWMDVWQAEHDRAFMVAGALKADLLADLAGAVQKAIDQGTGLEAFRADFREIVERHGWHGWTGEETKRGQAWRTKVIYKTNMATTYAAGRWAQLMKAGYPLLVYRHGGSLDPRLEHLSWDGLILPADHPFWSTHAPPNGWGCSCRVVGARSERDAVRVGGKPAKKLPDGWAVLNPKTGAPHGIDRGWAYAPGASVAETISQVAGKRDDLPPSLARALSEVIPDLPVPADPKRLDWQDWVPSKRVADVVAQARAAGVADDVVFSRGSPLIGAEEFARSAAEIMQRLDLPPMTAMSSTNKLPFRITVSKEAAAFYVPSRRAIGINATSLHPAKVTGNFDREEPPSEVANWHDQLGQALSAIRELGQSMRAAKMARRWSVVRDIRGIAAHELGHHLHYSFKAEIDQLMRSHRMFEDQWHLLISRYAGRNDREFLAESFTLYITGGEAEHYRLHPALLAYFKSKDRLK